jgi:hypothetical protein
MFNVPVRGLVLELAVTDQVSGPVPLPLKGEQVIQFALLEGVHGQTASAVTVSVPLAAAALTLALAGETA